MTLPRFVVPNFLAEVSNPHETPCRPTIRLEAGESAEAVRDLLESQGLKVHWVKEYDFSNWINKAQEATTVALTDYIQAKQLDQKFDFNPRIWGELKDYLFRLFHNRCAYCEAEPLIVSEGDVEHYRPKARVDEDPTHPGYYWLAYDVTNYLPECRKCNAARGKRNHFPLKEEKHRVASPLGDLGLEVPLLINPLVTAMGDYIEFRLEKMGDYPVSVAHPRSAQEISIGLKSIEFYNLNRADLIDLRGKESIQAMTDYLTNAKMLGSAMAKQLFESSIHRRQFPTACTQAVLSLPL